MKEHIWGETYIGDDVSSSTHELLSTATEYGESTGKYANPYSFWMDKKGWLYIKWILKNSELKAVVRYRFGDCKELIFEEIETKLTNKERLRGINSEKPVVLITGDTHRDFKRIIYFCDKYKTTVDDVIIILGDAGINYFNDDRDRDLKRKLAKLPVTLFCIHGNHEMRPSSINSYKLIDWKDGMAYAESEFPNLIFAKDGEIYDLDGKRTITIGGAYSVDKWYRLNWGYRWFEDEQPSEEIKRYVEEQLSRSDWKVDVVLSHTTPYKYRPVDLFISSINQSTVDSSTEEWLGDIEEKLSYEKWYAGHYHCDRVTDKLQIVYKNVELFGGERDLDFSML